MLNFDAHYKRYTNPFSLKGKKYEKQKLSDTLRLISAPHIEIAIDYGCGIGDASIALSGRANRILSIDGSAVALERLGARIMGRRLKNIELRHATIDDPWPIATAERADLILASEVLYYLSASELRAIGPLFRSSLRDEGRMLTCHYRKPFHDRILENEEVHHILVCSMGVVIDKISPADHYDLIVWKKNV